MIRYDKDGTPRLVLNAETELPKLPRIVLVLWIVGAALSISWLALIAYVVLLLIARVGV